MQVRTVLFALAVLPVAAVGVGAWIVLRIRGKRREEEPPREGVV